MLRPPGDWRPSRPGPPFPSGYILRAGASTARSQADQPPTPTGPKQSRTARRKRRAGTQCSQPPNTPPISARPSLPAALRRRRRPNPCGLEAPSQSSGCQTALTGQMQSNREAVGRRQHSSAFVLRPPCSRKRPILGGHGVKSTRRVRSVSTISRFSRFRLGSFSWPGPGPSRDCPGRTQDWARPLSGWVRAKPLSGRSMGLGRDGCTPPYPVGGMG